MSSKLLQLLQHLILLMFKSHALLALPHSQLESLSLREDAEYSSVLINCFHTNLTCKLSILLPTPCPEKKVTSLWFRADTQATRGPRQPVAQTHLLSNVQSKYSGHTWINMLTQSFASHLLKKELLLSRALFIRISRCLSTENTL